MSRQRSKAVVRLMVSIDKAEITVKAAIIENQAIMVKL